MTSSHCLSRFKKKKMMTMTKKKARARRRLRAAVEMLVSMERGNDNRKGNRERGGNENGVEWQWVV